MDINTLRIIVTLLAFATFAAIAVWSYLPARKRVQDERARSILGDEDEGRAP